MESIETEMKRMLEINLKLIECMNLIKTKWRGNERTWKENERSKEQASKTTSQQAPIRKPTHRQLLDTNTQLNKLIHYPVCCQRGSYRFMSSSHLIVLFGLINDNALFKIQTSSFSERISIVQGSFRLAFPIKTISWRRSPQGSWKSLRMAARSASVPCQASDCSTNHLHRCFCWTASWYILPHYQLHTLEVVWKHQLANGNNPVKFKQSLPSALCWTISTWANKEHGMKNSGQHGR